MADVPTLDKHDRPSAGNDHGPLVPNAHCINFLQEALDRFHTSFPWASRIATASVSVATTGIATAPTDFILDVRNGLIVTATRQRLVRVTYPRYLSFITGTPTSATGLVYTVQGRTLKCAPAPTGTLACTLHYYALPAVLGPQGVPDFPSDWCLIEYVRLRILEWTRALPAGSAITYADKEIAKLRTSGLANEPEDDNILLDPFTYGPSAMGDRNTWMGSTHI